MEMIFDDMEMAWQPGGFFAACSLALVGLGYHKNLSLLLPPAVGAGAVGAGAGGAAADTLARGGNLLSHVSGSLKRFWHCTWARAIHAVVALFIVSRSEEI